MKVGYHVADLKFEKKPVPLHWQLLRWLAYVSVFKKLRDHLGLSRIRNAYTGGAAMGPDHFRFFHALGVNLKQIYGQTEIAGISVLHRTGDIKFDTVGTAIPGTEVTDHRGRGNHLQEPFGLPGLLQESRGHGKDLEGRLALLRGQGVYR